VTAGIPIDFDRYPIADLDAPEARELIEATRAELALDGLSRLQGFITPAGVEAMIEEATAALPHAFPRNTLVPVYDELFEEWAEAAPGDDVSAEHPSRARQRSIQRLVAYDQIPPGVLRDTYESDVIPRFLSEILQRPVYQTADALLSLLVSVISDGEVQGWHFDPNDYVVSLLLQAPEAGGEFEFAPRIQSEQEKNFERVGKVLDGASDEVISVALEPGTLALFHGHDSLHRVAPVRGPRDRMIALLSYDGERGTVFSDAVCQSAVGRTSAASPPA
jgi:hypothetical protein